MKEMATIADAAVCGFWIKFKHAAAHSIERNVIERDLLEAIDRMEDCIAQFRTESKGYVRLTVVFASQEKLELRHESIRALLRAPALKPHLKNTTVEAIPRDFDRLLEAPLIILAAPRSGSTLLFDLISSLPESWSLGGESGAVFRGVKALQAAFERRSTDALRATDATLETAKALRIGFASAMKNRDGVLYLDLPAAERPKRVRFIEKTPENALRVEFIKRAFSDARFVFLHRDPRTNVASMIDSWRTVYFISRPELKGFNGPWSLLLPMNWRKFAKKSIAEISAFQWKSANSAICAGLRGLPKRVRHRIAYEELIENAEREIKKICAFSGMRWDRRARDACASVRDKTTISTLTPPHPEKWRRHERVIRPFEGGLNRCYRKISSI